jgi:succinyl-diaminopimelate desuccinylase
MQSALELTKELIACRSVTPADGGCQELIAKRLAAIGFETETIVSGPANCQVTNLWAIKRGSDSQGKVLAFAGHTDVVPTGPLEKWTTDPFVPSERDAHLYGRGAADMKTSLAGFVVASEEFVKQYPANDGTVIVCDLLKQRGQKLDYCVIGEPTSVTQLGDMIKNGRRGSLSGKLSIKGIQAHIAYPHLGRNPIHELAPALSKLVSKEWDRGNQYFQPTSFQISNIHAGTGANNVIPGELTIDFNFRFSTESKPKQLQDGLENILKDAGLEFEITWTLGGEPFLTGDGALAGAMRESIMAETTVSTELSTTGGTSDGRFIAKICSELVEFGPVNATSHKIDERVALNSIEPLKNIYRRVLEKLIA